MRTIGDLQTFVSPSAIAAAAIGIPAEETVLERYTFLPYVRTGIAASLRRPFSADAPARASVDVRVPVTGAVSERTDTASVGMQVRGPGDVVAIDVAQVIRRHPTPGTHAALALNLAHVELDRPDFPWMFTPAGPTAEQRLQPWICLAVVPLQPGRRSPVTPGAGGRLATLQTTRGELPALSGAWAWAHAQVMGGPGPEGSIERRLAPVNPAINLSRVLSPRRLEPLTSYVACLVPSFRAGVEAGLGQAVRTTTLAPAWDDAADPSQEIVLPVYDSFVFATTEAEDFKALAERIEPLRAPPGIGRRRMDASRPGHGLPDVAAPGTPEDRANGAEMIVRGPLVSPAPAGEQDGWPSEQAQKWPAEQHDGLVRQLNAPAIQRHAPPGADGRAPRPTVGPPIYAGAHIARDQVDPDAPGWFRDLNEDPRDRVVAGLGTRVVQQDQDALMASAWNQVAGVEAANAALRAAQLGRYVGASMHRRHLATLGSSRLLHVTAPAHARVLDATERTVSARVAASALPASVASGAFRRIARSRGPLARFADTAKLLSLTVRADDRVRSYVRPYRNPDGIDGVSTLTRTVIGSDAIDRAWGVSADPAAMLEQRVTALAGTSFPDALASGAYAQLDPSFSEPVTFRAGEALEQLLVALPEPALIRQDVDAAAVARTVAGQLDAVAASGRRWRVPVDVAVRAGLPVRGQVGTVAFVDREGVAALTTRVRRATGAHDGIERFDDPIAAARLGGRLTDEQPAPGVHRELLATIGARLVGSTPAPAQPDRATLRITDLGLLTKLDPARTVTDRVLGRMTTTPAWLASKWFDDLRVQPVMTAPSFSHAMYEALDRYDREWLIPGVGALATPDIATLLETNGRFVEAFLIGLNHEMARELIWREYPTDGRATCFRSFFTTGAELPQDVHALDGRPLGEHLADELKGAVVLLVRGELVRRYPGLVAHAVKQAGKDGDRPTFAAAPERTLFQINLAPNMLLVGFALTAAEVRMSDPGVKDPAAPYWFLLAENPTEPRFGLDEGGEGHPPHTRDDLTWQDLLERDDERFLSPAQPAPAPSVKDGPHPDSRRVVWGTDAAAVAHLLYQPPSRAAFRARALIDPGSGRE